MYFKNTGLITLFLIAVLLADTLFASDEFIYPPDQTIALWPQRPLREDSRFYARRKGNITHLTKETRPAIEFYKAVSEPEGEPVPAIIICPGGGYASLVYDLEGTEAAKWLNNIGIHAILLKYTVPSSHSSEAPLRDIQRALSVVRQRANEWGINPDMIGVMGFSAGGHLAARLSANSRQRIYEKIDDADDVSIRPDFTALIYPAYLSLNKSFQVSPDITVTADTPPTFIVHTKDDDQYVNGSIAYSRSLEANDIAVEFHLYEKGGHGFGMRSSPKLALSKWPELFDQWLKKLK